MILMIIVIIMEIIVMIKAITMAIPLIKIEILVTFKKFL